MLKVEANDDRNLLLRALLSLLLCQLAIAADPLTDHLVGRILNHHHDYHHHYHHQYYHHHYTTASSSLLILCRIILFVGFFILTIIIAANPLSDQLGGKNSKMMIKSVAIVNIELWEMVTCV